MEKPKPPQNIKIRTPGKIWGYIAMVFLVAYTVGVTLAVVYG